MVETRIEYFEKNLVRQVRPWAYLLVPVLDQVRTWGEDRQAKQYSLVVWVAERHSGPPGGGRMADRASWMMEEKKEGEGGLLILDIV
jgi:hypothetical protein